MTNRERIINTLSFKQSDRLPYSISLTQQMHEKMMADEAGAACWSRANNHITSASLNMPMTEVKPGFFKDEFGVVWNKTGADKDIGVVEGTIISDPDDLAGYEFPQVNERFITDACEWLVQNKKDNFSIADIGFSLFERAWTLCSMEDLLCYMITDPDFVHELMQKITDYNLKKMDITLAYDIDCNMFGDDWGQQSGLIMGPEHWREFIYPYLKQMYAKAKNAGRYVCQHSCGDLREIFDDVIEAGLNIYQTFQPEIYDMTAYKAILDGRLTIWGGISTQMDLPTATPAEIAEITEKTIDIMWKNGGYIGAPTHAVPFDVPVENLISMINVFESYKGK